MIQIGSRFTNLILIERDFSGRIPGISGQKQCHNQKQCPTKRLSQSNPSSSIRISKKSPTSSKSIVLETHKTLPCFLQYPPIHHLQDNLRIFKAIAIISKIQFPVHHNLHSKNNLAK
jgi:hypothetical protein